MTRHPILVFLVGWLVGGFFGFGQLLAFLRGLGAKPAAQPA